MPVKYMDHYEVDYTAQQLEGCDSWGAYVAIFTPSANPMHRNNIFPKQRVLADHAFATEAQAESEAEQAAEAIVGHLRLQHGSQDGAIE